MKTSNHLGRLNQARVPRSHVARLNAIFQGASRCVKFQETSTDGFTEQDVDIAEAQAYFNDHGWAKMVIVDKAAGRYIVQVSPVLWYDIYSIV